MDNLELLNGVGADRISQEEVANTSTRTIQALASLGIPVTLAEVREGPSVTMYGVRLGSVSTIRRVAKLDDQGNNVYDDKGHIVTVRRATDKQVTVNQLKTRLTDLKVALGTNDIRLEIPIEGTDLVGIEVPNGESTLIPLRSVLERTARTGPLAVGLGEGASGEPVSIDLARMPHLLIAGATGSGKSVCINTLLASLLVTRGPDELRLLLIDPKRVELAPYEGIPHLMEPVVTDVRRAAPALNRVINEMSRRYELLQGAGVRNITTYNNRVDDSDRLPYVVVVIDELADLMMTASKKVEESLCRLAQMGRATGIHLVIATQRPSVDVITGLIKANFPSRISFAVASGMDSRTVLDTGGAELLLGKGDMLYQAVDMSRPQRVQGCYIDDAEVVAVTDYWRGSDWAAPAVETAKSCDWSNVEDDDVRRAIEMLRVSVAEGDMTFYRSELSFRLGYSDKKSTKVTEELLELGVIRHATGGHVYKIVADFDVTDLLEGEYNRARNLLIYSMQDWHGPSLCADEREYYDGFDISEHLEMMALKPAIKDRLIKEIVNMRLVVPIGDNQYRFDADVFVKSDRVKQILAP